MDGRYCSGGDGRHSADAGAHIVARRWVPRCVYERRPVDDAELELVELKCESC